MPAIHGGDNLHRKLLFLFSIPFAAVLLHAQASADSLFVSKCATCHGKDGAGKTAFAQRTRIPDLGSSEVQSMSDRAIYDSIAKGTGHKEYPHSFAMRGMSTSEIESLVKKVREFAKK